MFLRLTPRTAVLVSYLFINFLSYALTGLDKVKAKEHTYRIREFSLILISFLMGALGVFIAMKEYHHKTRKLKFKILIPLALICNIAVICIFYFKVYVFLP